MKITKPLAAFIPWMAFSSQSFEWPDQVRVRVSANDCQGGRIYMARTAVTPEQRSQGLSRRTRPLRSDEAMLFIFDQPGPQSFWMKETWIPLSIFFFGVNGSLLSSQEMRVETNPTQPKARYTEMGQVSAVLEVSPGRAQHVKVSDARLCIDSSFFNEVEKGT